MSQIPYVSCSRSPVLSIIILAGHERFCSDSKLRRLEVRKRGKHELAVSSRIRDGVVNIGNLDRGVNTGLVVDEGTLTAFGVFGVVSGTAMSKQQCKVFPMSD